MATAHNEYRLKSCNFIEVDDVCSLGRYAKKTKKLFFQYRKKGELLNHTSQQL